MIVGIVVLVFTALLLFILSWQVWKEEKLDLVNPVSRRNISDENRKPFCAAIGKGLLIMGIGTLLSALLLFLKNTWLIVSPIALSYTVGIVVMAAAVIRFNRES